MSEEIIKTEEKFEVPLPTLTKEDLDNNKEKLEEANKALTPPEGKVMKGMRAFCSIHGDITRASHVLKFVRYFQDEEGKMIAVPYSDIICKACLSDMWRKGVEKGDFGKVVAAPIFGDPESEDKKEDSSTEEKVEESK